MNLELINSVMESDSEITDGDLPLISLVVTCKNRLDYLKKSLPTFQKMSFTEIIVVDYSCEEGSGSWVRENYPQSQVVTVSVNDNEVFNLSRARNAGAKVAKGKFLFFIDADVLIHLDLGMWFAKQLQSTPSSLHCTVNGQLNRNLYGTHICKKSDFNLVNLYDEAFIAWGSEDVDLYFRLMQLDIAEINFPEAALESLPHSNAIRQISKKSGGLGSIKAQMIANRLYMNIKYDLEAFRNRPLDLLERQEIMKIVRDIFFKELESSSSKSSRKIAINIPNRLFNRLDTRSHFTKQLVYEVHVNI